MKHLLGELEAARVAWPDVLAALDAIGGPERLVDHTTVDWLSAPRNHRLTVLALLGHRELLATPGRHGGDYPGGKFHQQYEMPEFSELDVRRYPPTGDRALWVRYGPAGPPPVAIAPGVAA